MRVMGYNVVAILVSAIAIYAIGFVIYGLIIDPAVWMKAAGITKEQMDAVGTSRMIYSPLMPLVTATGMAVLFKWANVSGLSSGVRYGALVAILSAIPTIWYGWVYGVGDCTGPLIDSAHLLIGHVTAGAILASWK